MFAEAEMMLERYPDGIKRDEAARAMLCRALGRLMKSQGYLAGSFEGLFSLALELDPADASAAQIRKKIEALYGDIQRPR